MLNLKVTNVNVFCVLMKWLPRPAVPSSRRILVCVCVCVCLRGREACIRQG